MNPTLRAAGPLSGALLLLLVGASSAQEHQPIPTVGTGLDYTIEPSLGDAETLADGSQRWNHWITIENATFLKAHLVDVALAPGDRLLVRTDRGRVVDEITGRGPKDMGTFWSLSAPGDSLELVLETRGRYPTPPFRVDEIIAGHADLFDRPPADGPESICAPADFEDVICYDNDPGKWSTILASVGVMSVGGNPTSSLFCSGTNIQGNNILTNDHCVGSQGSCNNTEFVFKYYRTGCNDGSPTTVDWVSYRCDQLLVESPWAGCEVTPAILDFNLFSVIGDPESMFGAVEADPTPLTDGEAIYIVQHPSGRPHEVTHGAGANVDVDGSNLRYYDSLDTEGGSSGSPIFRESDNKLVGLHHCGGCSSAGVGNRGMLMSDIYPLIEPFLTPPAIFTDGFESGDVSAWSTSVP